jgi:hypothetical protein
MLLLVEEEVAEEAEPEAAIRSTSALVGKVIQDDRGSTMAKKSSTSEFFSFEQNCQRRMTKYDRCVNVF